MNVWEVHFITWRVELKKSYLPAAAWAAQISCSVCLPGVCSNGKVQLQNWEKCWKNGFGVGFVLLEISPGFLKVQKAQVTGDDSENLRLKLLSLEMCVRMGTNNGGVWPVRGWMCPFHSLGFHKHSQHLQGEGLVVWKPWGIRGRERSWSPAQCWCHTFSRCCFVSD